MNLKEAVPFVNALCFCSSEVEKKKNTPKSNGTGKMSAPTVKETGVELSEKLSENSIRGERG
jgi:hypothetical protein